MFPNILESVSPQSSTSRAVEDYMIGCLYIPLYKSHEIVWKIPVVAGCFMVIHSGRRALPCAHRVPAPVTTIAIGEVGGPHDLSQAICLAPRLVRFWTTHTWYVQSMLGCKNPITCDLMIRHLAMGLASCVSRIGRVQEFSTRITEFRPMFYGQTPSFAENPTIRPAFGRAQAWVKALSRFMFFVPQ